MSAICAVVRFDGAPVDPERFRRMTAASDYRGPDGIHHWIEGSVALAHLALHTTPEAQRERQPLVHASGHLVLAADARIDNRRDLIAALKARGDPADPEPTDADLILAAYERWGDDCPKHLIGDYAFVVWDRRRRRLFCARDALGVRVLHYYQRGGDLLVATTAEAIISWLGERPPLNDAYLRDRVAMSVERGCCESAFQDLLRLPPGCALTARDEQLDRSRYWQIPDDPASGSHSAADAAEVFRALFEQAIRACLRGAHPVGLLVSGGLDSSSIACLTDRLIGLGEINLLVRLYSNTFATTPGADEREYVQAVVQHCRHLHSTLIPSDDCWGLKDWGVDNFARPLNGPDSSVLQANILKRSLPMQADGVRAFLTGVGADEMLSGHYLQPGNLRTLPWARVRAELPHFVRYGHRPAWEVLARAYLLPWLPEPVLMLLRRLRRPAVSNRLCAPSNQPIDDLLPLTPRLREYPGLMIRSNPPYLTALDNFIAPLGLEHRAPFLDRRLVEFLLTIPPACLFKDGSPKFLLREAMAGILVEKVRWRTTKAHVSGATAKGLHEQECATIRALLKDSRVVARGYVTQPQLEQRWAAYWSSADPLNQTRNLVGFLCVETWLRALA